MSSILEYLAVELIVVKNEDTSKRLNEYLTTFQLSESMSDYEVRNDTIKITYELDLSETKELSIFFKTTFHRVLKCIYLASQQPVVKVVNKVINKPVHLSDIRIDTVESIKVLSDNVETKFYFSAESKLDSSFEKDLNNCFNGYTVLKAIEERNSIILDKSEVEIKDKNYSPLWKENMEGLQSRIDQLCGTCLDRYTNLKNPSFEVYFAEIYHRGLITIDSGYTFEEIIAARRFVLEKERKSSKKTKNSA
jgi:hypothetical protein